MNIITSASIEFQDLREKLTVELLRIGRNSLACKRTMSLTGMALILGISKETAFNLLESLEQAGDITIDCQKILVKESQDKT